MAAGHRRARLLQQLQQVPIADEDSGQIGEAVPAQLEEAEVEQGRIETKVGEGDRGGTARLSLQSNSCSAPGASPLRCRLIG